MKKSTIYILESTEIPTELLNHNDQNENVTIIPLNHELTKKLQENNFKIIEEKEFLEFSDYASIDELTYELGRNWYKDTTDEKLLYDKINIQIMLHREIYQIFLRMIHRIFLLLKIIEKTNPENIKITNFDSVLNEISINIFKSKKIEYEILDSTPNKKEIKDRFDKVNFSIKILGKNREIYLSKKNFKIIKKIYEKYWNIRFFFNKTSLQKKSNSKSFLLLDFNLVLFESFVKYLSDKKYNLLFLNNRRPIIWNEKSLNIAKEIRFEKINQKDIKITDAKIYKKFRSLIEKNFLSERFIFSGIKLDEHFQKLILEILKKRLPEFILNIEQTKKLITNKKIDGVWTLDDYANDKAIVNTFQNHNIPVLAILPGNLTYQQQNNVTLVEPFPLDRTADKLLIWGENDLKNCKDTGVDLSKVAIGGAPRYEKFEELNNDDEDYVLILVGAFPSTAHSVFLSASYILEFEEKMKKIFFALKKINKKIILKRHPTQGINEIIDYENILLDTIPDATVLKEANTIDLISKSSLIIASGTSTILEESILLDKTIILLPYLENNELIPYTSTNAVLGIENIEKISDMINDCLHDTKTREELSLGRQKFIEKVFEFRNSASKRHDEIMNEVISEKNNS